MIFFNKLQILAVSAVLIVPSGAVANSNKSDVRKSLSNDGWQTEFLAEFDQSRSEDFSGRVGATSACVREIEEKSSDLETCYEHVRPIFLDTLPQTAETAALAVSDDELSEDMVFEMLLASLTSASVQSEANLEVHVGLAVFQNWITIVTHQPAVRMQVRDLGFGIKTKIPVTTMEEHRIRQSLPNTFQPYVRWRTIERDTDE